MHRETQRGADLSWYQRQGLFDSMSNITVQKGKVGISIEWEEPFAKRECPKQSARGANKTRQETSELLQIFKYSARPADISFYVHQAAAAGVQAVLLVHMHRTEQSQPGVHIESIIGEYWSQQRPRQRRMPNANRRQPEMDIFGLILTYCTCWVYISFCIHRISNGDPRTRMTD